MLKQWTHFLFLQPFLDLFRGHFMCSEEANGARQFWIQNVPIFIPHHQVQIENSRRPRIQRGEKLNPGSGFLRTTSGPQLPSRWKCLRNWDSSTGIRECHFVALLAVTQNVSQWENENYSTLPAFYFTFQSELIDLQSSSEVCMTSNCEICRQPELTTAPWTCIPSMGPWWQKVLQGITSCLNIIVHWQSKTSQMWLTHPNPDPALKVNPSITGSALCEWGHWCRDGISSDVGEVSTVWLWSMVCGCCRWSPGGLSTRSYGSYLVRPPQGRYRSSHLPAYCAHHVVVIVTTSPKMKPKLTETSYVTGTKHLKNKEDRHGLAKPPPPDKTASNINQSALVSAINTPVWGVLI